MNSKPGTLVRQVVATPIQGVIVETRWNQVSDCKEILVSYNAPGGEPGSRWFLEAQLVEVNVSAKRANRKEPV